MAEDEGRTFMCSVGVNLLPPMVYEPQV